jgi:hypothetical protein
LLILLSYLITITSANPNMSYIPVTEYFNAAIIQK